MNINVTFSRPEQSMSWTEILERKGVYRDIDHDDIIIVLYDFSREDAVLVKCGGSGDFGVADEELYRGAKFMKLEGGKITVEIEY